MRASAIVKRRSAQWVQAIAVCRLRDLNVAPPQQRRKEQDQVAGAIVCIFIIIPRWLAWGWWDGGAYLFDLLFA